MVKKDEGGKNDLGGVHVHESVSDDCLSDRVIACNCTVRHYQNVIFLA